MIRVLSRSLGALPIAIALQACTSLKPGSDRAQSKAAPAEALLEASVASTCPHRAPPARPNVMGSGGSLDLVFAVSYASYGTSVSSIDDAGSPLYLGFGFDLDDTCTGEGQGSSCLEPPWANADHTDGLDGIDNAAAQVAAMEVRVGLDHGPTTEAMANQILRVRGYSGEPDDDEVDVAIYIGFGLAPREGGATGLLWDGDDRWMILPDTLAPLEDGATTTNSLDQPRFHDEHAYVSGGVLVARLPEALWPTGLVVAPSSLGRVEQVVLAGNLVRVGAQWELQHLVTGVRDPLQSLLSIVARIGPQGGQPVCQSATAYLATRRRLCSFVDIASGPDSPSSTFDAFSGGSRPFRQRRATAARQGRVTGGVGPYDARVPPHFDDLQPSERLERTMHRRRGMSSLCITKRPS